MKHMKHFALMAAMLLCSLSMSAQVVQIDGIWYKLLEWYDHSAAVAVPQDGTKYSGAISIPSSVMYEGEEYRVDSIDSYVFQNCDGLTSVIIPEGMSVIGEGTFKNCIGLNSIHIPESVTSIENGAFDGCSSLTSVTILGNITGGLYDDVCYAFKDCNNLECVTLNCPTVGTWFSGMTSIKEIVAGAFGGCSGLAPLLWVRTWLR